MADNTFGAPLIAEAPAAYGNPLAVINPDQAAQDNEAKAKQTFDAAIDTRDTKQLASVYQSNPQSEVGQAALNAVNHINTETKKFQSVVDPIEKAGGPGTPGGNIAAAQQFGSNPKLGSALVAYLMGQKEAAFNLATGGQEKESVEFGKDGGRFYRTTNALGQTVKVLDSENNQLTPQQVQDLGIGYSSYEATQKAKLEQENKKARQDVSQLDTQVANDWGNQADAHARLVAPLIEGVQQIKSQIPLATFKKIIGIVNSGTSVGAGGSTSEQKLGTKSATTNTGEEKSGNVGGGGSVGGGENAVGGVSAKAGASAGTKSGTSVTGSDQNISGKTARQDREETLAKNKASLLAEAQTAGIKDQKQLELLMRTFDVMAQIKQEQGDLAARLGKKPSFISMIGATKLGDQQSQLEAQMLQVLHNHEQMTAYQPFYNGSMEAFRKTGTVPDFGQIESQFVSKSKEHANVSNKYSELIGQALDRNAREVAATPVVAAAEVGLPPPASAVKKAPVAKNAPVAPPRLSLDEIGKLYANQLKKS